MRWQMYTSRVILYDSTTEKSLYHEIQNSIYHTIQSSMYHAILGTRHMAKKNSRVTIHGRFQPCIMADFFYLKTLESRYMANCSSEQTFQNFHLSVSMHPCNGAATPPALLLPHAPGACTPLLFSNKLSKLASAGGRSLLQIFRRSVLQ